MARPSPTLAADEMYDRLGRFVRNRVRNRADAEDVLQDVLIKLLSHESPAEAGKLWPWVYAVARNHIIDFYRARARGREHVAEDVVEASGDDPREAPPVDLSKAVAPLLGLLSEQDQQALRVVDLEGTSQKRYAEQLGLDYTTAKSRVQRARKRLRREFERCCEILRDRRGRPIEATPRADDCC